MPPSDSRPHGRPSSVASSVAARACAALVLGGGLAALLPAASARDAAPEEVAAPSACATLGKTYRSLEGAETVPEAERKRIASLILERCGVVEIRLIRASTLEGTAVLEMPLRGFAGAGERP